MKSAFRITEPSLQPLTYHTLIAFICGLNLLLLLSYVFWNFTRVMHKMTEDHSLKKEHTKLHDSHV